MRKFTKKEIKKLKKHWKRLQRWQDEFDFGVRVLEQSMQKDVKIKDLEFFLSDGGYCGIGNFSRTIELISDEKLEKK